MSGLRLGVVHVSGRGDLGDRVVTSRKLFGKIVYFVFGGRRCEYHLETEGRHALRQGARAGRGRSNGAISVGAGPSALLRWIGCVVGERYARSRPVHALIERWNPPRFNVDAYLGERALPRMDI